MIVILNEVKNLIISTESIVGILRLMPQNDIATQSQRAREGSICVLNSSLIKLAFFFGFRLPNSRGVRQTLL